MKKFKSYFIKQPNAPKEYLGIFEEKKDAIDACINKASNDYCLDTEQDRRMALQTRNFCICGCGPRQIGIEEIEE